MGKIYGDIDLRGAGGIVGARDATLDDELVNLRTMNAALEHSCFYAVNSVSSTTIGTSALTLTVPNVIDNDNIAYSSGEITVNHSGCYHFSVSVNIGIAGSETRVFEMWIEKWNSGASTWNAVAYSGFRAERTSNAEGLFAINKMFDIESGEKFRFRAKSDHASNVTLVSYTLSNGVVSPAISISIKE